jgi:hypothetical protein
MKKMPALLQEAGIYSSLIFPIWFKSMEELNNIMVGVVLNYASTDNFGALKITKIGHKPMCLSQVQLSISALSHSFP